MRIYSIGFQNSFTAQKQEMSNSDKKLYDKLVNLSRFPKNSIKRNLAIEDILKFLEKDIGYQAYKNTSVEYSYSEIQDIIKNNIRTILDNDKKIEQRVKMIRNAINFSREEKPIKIITPRETDLSALSDREQELIKLNIIMPANQMSEIINLTNNTITKKLNNISYKIQRKAGSTKPFQIQKAKEFAELYKTTMLTMSDNESINENEFLEMAEAHTTILKMKQSTMQQKFIEYREICREYGIDKATFKTMLKKCPEMLGRDLRGVFNNIDELEKQLDSKEFKKSEFIKAVTKYPKLLTSKMQTLGDNILSSSDVLAEFGVTKDEYIKACFDSPSLMVMPAKTILSKIEEVNNIFKDEDFDKAKFAKAAVRRSVILTLTPQRIEYNIKSTVKKYKDYGLTVKKYLNCALKNPALFYRKPESVQQNLDTIVQNLKSVGLTTSILIDNIENKSIILTLDPNTISKKMKIFYKIIKEEYADKNLTNEDIWKKVLHKPLDYSFEKIMVSKLNYHMLKDKKLGKNNEYMIPEIIRKNSEKTYKISLENNAEDREFAKFAEELSIKSAGKNIFIFEFKN